jgi:hypothetical protein
LLPDFQLQVQVELEVTLRQSESESRCRICLPPSLCRFLREVASALGAARPAPPAPRPTVPASEVGKAPPAPPPVPLVALLRSVVDSVTRARYASLADLGARGAPTIAAPASGVGREVALTGSPRPLQQVADLMTALTQPVRASGGGPGDSVSGPLRAGDWLHVS